MIVTLAHLRGVRGFNARPGFCHSKSREWFGRHNLDWNEFRKRGVDAELLEATGDPMAIALAAHARAEADRGR